MPTYKKIWFFSVQWARFLFIFSSLTIVFGANVPANGQSLNKNTFENVAEQAGLTDQRESLFVSWIDYDGDGWLDLWLGVHGGFSGVRPRLYQNQGDGTFSEISDRIWATAPPIRDMHGGTWADVDNDGDPDLMQTVGGGGGKKDYKESNYFYVNEGGKLVDRAAQMGLEHPYGRGRGALWLDYDGDGKLDLLQTNEPRPSDPYARSRLFHQITGLKFEHANKKAGVQVPEKASLAQLGEVTGDGEMDLVTYGFPFPQSIYRGGSLPLKRVDTSLVQIRPKERNWVVDGVIRDLNGDFRSDFYLTRRRNASNVFQEGDSLLAVRLHHFSSRPGKAQLTFQSSGSIELHSLFPWRPFAKPAQTHIGKGGYEPSDVSLKWKRVKKHGDGYLKGQSITLSPDDPANWGVDTSQTSGLVIGYNPEKTKWVLQAKGNRLAPLMIRAQEGDLRDVSLNSQRAPYMDNLLWVYDKDEGRYVDRTTAANLDRGSACTSVGSGDFDNDMDVDLYLSCAHMLRGLPNKLLENQGDGTFRAVPAAGGAAGATQVTGWNALGTPARVAVADYDRDGFLDLLIPPTGTILATGKPVPAFPTTPLQLFRNTGNGNHWLEVDLTGTVSNADGIGARVDVTTDSITQRRFQSGKERHYAQDQKRLHFGLGKHTQVDTITVRWPSGRTQTFSDLDADQVLQLTEGENIPRSLSIKTFSLSPFGANPFRRSTRFKLKVNRRQHVRVAVFDALGRRVKVLHNGIFPEGAIKVLRLDGSNLASGMYFVRAQGEKAVQTCKVVRLK